MSPQPESASATHSKVDAAQGPRLNFISLRCIHVVTVVTCPDTRLLFCFAMIPRADPRYVLLGKPVSTFSESCRHFRPPLRFAPREAAQFAARCATQPSRGPEHAG